MSGNPFCNSSRNCSYICDKSCVFDQAQTTSRIYRISAHVFLTGIAIIIALYVKGNIALTALIFLGVVVIFSSTFFVSFHADIADAELIAFLYE
jgi:putative lipase involved disintegration of autophagic bodies